MKTEYANNEERNLRIIDVSNILAHELFANEKERKELSNELYVLLKEHSKARRAVKIQLTCPNCGGSDWFPTSKGDFECLSCGDAYVTEWMTSEVFEINKQNKEY